MKTLKNAVLAGGIAIACLGAGPASAQYAPVPQWTLLLSTITYVGGVGSVASMTATFADQAACEAAFTAYTKRPTAFTNAYSNFSAFQTYYYGNQPFYEHACVPGATEMPPS